MDERSVAGPLNLTVPGGAGGEAPLPLRLLDCFCLYVRQEYDSEVLTGLEALQDGAHVQGCMQGAALPCINLSRLKRQQDMALTLLLQLFVHGRPAACCEQGRGMACECTSGQCQLPHGGLTGSARS